MYTLSYIRLFLGSCLMAVAIVVVVAGCSAQQTQTPRPTPLPLPTSTPTPSPTPLPRGGDLTVRLSQDIPLLQPWRPRSRNEEHIISLLYNGLVRLDDKLQPQPDLAERWDVSPDGRLITFTMRSGLQWHDGEPLDAVDAHFTLDRMKALPFTATALLDSLHHIAAIATPDRNTLTISLTERYAPILAHLTVPVLPRHLLEDTDIGSMNFWDMPVGSGPFQVAHRNPGESIVLTRFEQYYRGAPLLDRVVFVGAADVPLVVDALADERLLLAELAPAQVVPQLPNNIRSGSYAENGFYFVGFNLREGRPFADVRVRQALVTALDVSSLVDAVTKGGGMVLSSSGTPGSWADLTPLPKTIADLDGARALLTEAGWTLSPGSTIRQRNGDVFSATLFVRGDDPRRVAAATIIAETAASIGLHIAVEPVDFATVILSKYAPPYDYDVLLSSWSNGAGDPTFSDYTYYDPDDFALFHSSQINQGPLDTRITRNMVGFSDPAYDTHIQTARQMYDIATRTEAYRQTQARIANMLPYLYLWADRVPVLLNKRVVTLHGPISLTTPNYFWNIETWFITQ